MSAGTGHRGRPATLKKAEIDLEDGSVAVLRLLGPDGSVQLVLPERWSLSRFDRAVSVNGGRTQISFTKD
jgi:hypothetical protein